MLKGLFSGIILAIVATGTLGIGAFSIDVPEAEASWTVVYEITERIMLSVWKGVVLPLLRYFVLSWASGASDLPLFPTSISGLIDFVTGSALNAFFQAWTGIALCAGIQLNIKLAISLLFFYGSYRIDYTFKGCRLTDIIERSGANFSWETHAGLFQREGSSLGQYFAAGDEASVTVGEARYDVLSDLFASGGALSLRDCSGDLNGNGRKNEVPADCRVTTPGGVVEKLITQQVSGSDNAAKSSVYFTDAVALGAEAMSVYINTLLLDGLSSLSTQKGYQGGKALDGRQFLQGVGIQ